MRMTLAEPRDSAADQALNDAWVANASRDTKQFLKGDAPYT
jgi:hypothetical protein